jgi:hypothetical protein
MNRVQMFTKCSLLMASTSCASIPDGARDQFAKAYTCPPEQVTVTRRADVAPHQMLGALVARPPADVASDPSRLRYWNSEQADTMSRLDQSCEVYEARGCGQKSLLCCAHPRSPDGDGESISEVSCTSPPLVLLVAPPGS